MSRTIIPLWNNWLFKKDFNNSDIRKDIATDDFTPVGIPHMVQEIPYNYFDERNYQCISCYRREFAVDESMRGSRVFIDFEGVMAAATVYINEKKVGTHKGGYTPFSFDITDYVLYSKSGAADNLLVVEVDSTERADIPPFGFAIDYLTYGGIYREVCLRFVPEVYIKDVFFQPLDSDKLEKKLLANIEFENTGAENKDITYSLVLKDMQDTIIAAVTNSCIAAAGTSFQRAVLTDLQDIQVWDIENPQLYRAELCIVSDTSRDEDIISATVGFRTAEFTPEGFFLNGKQIKIRGLNRHQAYPYVGYAMPKRAQQDDADILKHELGINLVRTSHYPQSKHFLNRCDEIGLLVFEEIPGWQHIGDEAWQDVACKNVEEMILRDRNHASIVLWGVRINESPDSHNFYLRTNEIARRLDPTRQTAGVRCHANSDFLEDVYTMNDFICGSVQPDTLRDRALRPQREITGQADLVPYMVTEFAGHMYPTKRFDQEERLVEHATKHLMVQNTAALNPHICGAIGWCAFDYNTHYNFGSGDRICYHGVMDMFRIPKFAAAVYASQMPPSKKAILEPLTRYTIGERSIGGIAPLMICTNCDSVRVVIGEQDLGLFYPSKERFAGLEHPPIIISQIEGVWGGGWLDAAFIGYVNEKEVAIKRFACNPTAVDLAVHSDHTELSAYEPDTTRITVKLTDRFGNELSFSDAIIKVQLEGPAEIIGPKEFALIGGVRAFWIKTKFESGTVTVNVASEGFKTKQITIQVT
ncbi:glycoside hydrolase family 2 protein [Treponema phagedenis]|uniref:glycoside hydrolase family 2 protein n=1 Tax=Treponema phagedenis TaxID=162 RepID=UPI0011E67806|nr:glycoside hydrolase family 2 TIM barrel-domain containing protein [Treponema phagedenis]QEJ96234.1 glycoside hydrolase family 2 protein [Treponema phagedenis]QEK04912.1 glycoside hydrolase family 2 protein [Treponema phagedenis]TYT78931.1 glycoside hydrolase family 2 protein [Treponema phagedenis]